MNSIFAGKSILIVDDDPISALLFQEILEPTNANLLVAHDGCSAITIIKTQHVDLVLLDIKLPDCNGYDVLLEIRKINSKIIAIAQTANALVDDQVKCMEAGFDDYISKPIISNELFFKLEKYLKSSV